MGTLSKISIISLIHFIFVRSFLGYSKNICGVLQASLGKKKLFSVSCSKVETISKICTIYDARTQKKNYISFEVFLKKF